MSALRESVDRTSRRLPAVLRHEWFLACVAALAVGIFVNRGALADPTHTLPQDVWDPSLEAYLIAWVGHAVLHNPLGLWQLNSFYPAHLSLAFDDSLLGYSPFGFFGTGPDAAVLRYNIVFTFANALAFLGAYALLRQLGSNRVGGAIAGLVFATAPWRWAHGGHLNVLSTGGMALALAMLARGHGLALARRTPERTAFRPGWALAGWLVATWQITLGFAVGLVFGYVMAGCTIGVVIWWLIRKRRPTKRLLVMDIAGGLTFAVVTVLMAIPYLRVLAHYPNARRGEAELALFSPTMRGFFTAVPESWFWGPLGAANRAQMAVPGEMSIMLGATLYILAAVGLVWSVWSLRARLLMLVGVVFSAILDLGINGPFQGGVYLWLLHHLPGFEGLRTPGRMVVWTSLILALLAAGMVTALGDAVGKLVRDRGIEWRVLAQAALVIPVVLVFIEGINTTPHPFMDAKPASLSMVEGPYLVLPSDILSDQHVDLWSTDYFPTVLNGSSSFNPPDIDETRNKTADFPSPDSIAFLHGLGVKSVVIFPWAAPQDSKWSDPNQLTAPMPGVRSEIGPDGAVIFHLE